MLHFLPYPSDSPTGAAGRDGFWTGVAPRAWGCRDHPAAVPIAQRQAVLKRDPHRVPMVVPQGYSRPVTGSEVVPQSIVYRHTLRAHACQLTR